ncbi:ribonuclease P protein component [Nitrosococcus oceani]|uniref:Ribonuclease P protein component n=2 Tax=Nitrosococcus oceani TaxID=1229 RepID=RNPA_NITOC|nr:ribonuclease P protein component [Nitrosococcus oceani]Q3J6L7.1 RecName: Full=Ribonuclease P protein component; Short=RNase P protein; Short=RNaseP protein; AltName: Full=Protein C5 [Nitrosococcus oceani ATCC 19707]KFI18095.1 ribonuclease P [Nitrosococcus oceani C-27]ABA59529.1 ribonuclease P protein component [Nitrosococcus oceani ATCC 19707]EDZ66498.1 ribonuclease P protein component [Nitrosococcus oceani AFC27]KFI24094.1 ribonuclease P [Nitrosococcus oceani]GEM21344.1 ribonuclease P pro
MKQFGFTRLMRLVDPGDFKQIFAAGERVSSKAFTVLYHSNSLEYPRLGMAIPRKHFSRAVDRNRIKRLVRESFRQRQQVLGGRDLVVLSKPGINRHPNSDLLRCLERQWIGLVKQCSDS